MNTVVSEDSDDGMDRRLPHTAAFPQALGTGIIVNASQPIPEPLHRLLGHRIAAFEAAFSRFRDDSTVGAIARSAHGGTFTFPDEAEPLFALYDRLFAVSDGAIDPLVGADLTKLGYGRDLTFHMDDDGPTARPSTQTNAGLGALHGRPTWAAVEHAGSTLTTTQAVQLDFGAAGKGMMVDLLAQIIEQELPGIAYVIDAGGDLRIRMPGGTPIRVALEDPADTSCAIGMADITQGSLCASAPSRRHWQIGSGRTLHEVHHLLNAVDGRPVHDIAATWAFVPCNDIAAGRPATVPDPFDATWFSARYPTALADALATALFVIDPGDLAEGFATRAGSSSFHCALLDAGHRAVASAAFPARFFTR